MKSSFKGQKLIAGEGVNFYFSAPKGWYAWGKNAEQFTGVKSEVAQNFGLSIKNTTSQLWQKVELDIVEIANCG
ncbi:hypothetical protein [Legionella cardiaca]|uniref:Uncharacterized protein n=1 Tax=Legionella cardiaca TaxID=1071983 RepID=A0ABY8ASS1_9GAMM|nr:hypothetical protein [Legionella cardiaca]WED43730.1 hypothetical protein PXX05_02835 [Legionella cardiaca]